MSKNLDFINSKGVNQLEIYRYYGFLFWLISTLFKFIQFKYKNGHYFPNTLIEDMAVGKKYNSKSELQIGDQILESTEF